MDNTLIKYPGDEGKSESYVRRRNFLLQQMKKQKWEEVEDRPKCNRGRKPKPAPVPKIDLDKPRNKFFKFD